MSQFPKSKGALFVNAQKSNEKHPDLRGHVMVTPEQIQMLIAMGQSGVEVKLSVAGWQRVSQSNQGYIYLEGEAYMKQPDQQPQGYPSQQGYPQQPQYGPPQYGPPRPAPQQVPQMPYQQPQVPMPQYAPTPQVPQSGGWPAPMPPAPMPQQVPGYAPQYQQQPMPQMPEPPDFQDDDIPF